MPFSLPQGLKLTWLGHSAFLIETPDAKRILIDPWIQNNPACPADKKEVGAVDLMLVTHGHFDHIEDAIPIAQATNCKVVGIYELAAYLMRHGVNPASADGKIEYVYPMNKGGTIHFPDLALSVTMVHADHSCGIKEGDAIIYGGEAVGYIVTLDSGFTFYHTGDTAVFSDMAMISQLYQPTLVMLPIGDRFVMSPREAAHAATLLTTAEALIPLHFGTFPMLTGTLEAFQSELSQVNTKAEVLAFTPGETKGA